MCQSPSQLIWHCCSSCVYSTVTVETKILPPQLLGRLSFFISCGKCENVYFYTQHRAMTLSSLESIFLQTQTYVILEYLQSECSVLQCIEAAMLITAEQHRRFTKPSLEKDLLYRHSIFKRPQSFIDNPFKDLWLCSQVSAGLLWTAAPGFCRNTNIHSIEEIFCSFSFHHLISSGNFPLQLVPGDYHLALKPWCTSAHRTNETPELGDGQIAKWYLSSMALWQCFSLSVSFPTFLSCVKCPRGAPWDLEGREIFLDKGGELRTTQINNSLGAVETRGSLFARLRPNTA